MQMLVGDIGGTKTGLALAHRSGERIRLESRRRYPSRDFASLAAIVGRYLDQTGAAVDAASLAVAGPVRDGRSRTTNLPWEIDGADLALRFGLRQVRLLNDLEAVGWGIADLGEQDTAVLQAGDADAAGNACVVAAGTGLGQAGLYWDGRRHRPFATEGGHADFAPLPQEPELSLLAYLQARHGHVSWERVVSGMGIGNLYRFLADRAGNEHAAAVERALLGGGDLAAAVATTASQDACPVCAEAMALFVRLYGREAGNVALKHLALGGVYLGGGIAPKNLELLRAPGFLEAFRDKGRMSDLMARMPVRVILDPYVALRGAARYLVEG